MDRQRSKPLQKISTSRRTKEINMPPENDNQTFGVAVGRIQGDMIHVLSTKRDKDNAKEEYRKLDDRITAVERFMWRFAGVVRYSLLYSSVFTPALWLLGNSNG